MTYYCLNREDGGQCPAPTADQIASFQSGMQACFRRAVDVGFTTLAVAPHLDDGLGLGGHTGFLPSICHEAAFGSERLTSAHKDASLKTCAPSQHHHMLTEGNEFQFYS